MWSVSLKHRDDVEDDELIVNQFTEGMPTTIGGFKNHPLFAFRSFFCSTTFGLKFSSHAVMYWSGTCSETRSSRKTHTNSASSAASLFILAARF